ncbi:MAG: VCBS repeat-containing protein [Rickettsiales bacterium]|nr:VCBS repeat-containing protein [Rickettsiales bacterium]
MHTIWKQNTGSSLIWVSALVAAAGVTIASTLPSGREGSDAQKQAITMKRMATIEDATRAYMATNLARPCPADITLAITNANFGVSATSEATACTWGFPNFTNLSYAINSSSGGYSTTKGNNTLTVNGTGNTTTFQVGQTVTGAAFPPLSRVRSIDTSTTLTVDAPAYATSTATNTLTINNTIAGGVPTKALGLPDDYAFDGWGRRIVYVMDSNAGRADNCRAMQSTGMAGGLKILPSAPTVTTGTLNGTTSVTSVASYANISTGFLVQGRGIVPGTTVTNVSSGTITLSRAATVSGSGIWLNFTPPATDNTMWALLSYGKDGYGAFPQQGSTIANRLNNGNTNVDSQINAFVSSASSMTDNFATNFVGLVKRDSYGTGLNRFDDIVWYLDSSKNTCALGEAAEFVSSIRLKANYWRINGITTGDINGDGISDLVIGSEDNASNNQKTFVIFGRKKGWFMPVGTLNYLDADTSLNGYNGFAIEGAAPTGRTTVSGGTYYGGSNVLDANADGFDDVVVYYKYHASFPSYAGYAVLLGGSNGPVGTSGTGWAASYSSNRPFSTSNGFTLNYPTPTSTTEWCYPYTGNVVSDAAKDIILNCTPDSGTNLDAYIYAGVSGASSGTSWGAGSGLATPSVTVQNAGGYTGADMNGDGTDDGLFVPEGASPNMYIQPGPIGAGTITNITTSSGVIKLSNASLSWLFNTFHVVRDVTNQKNGSCPLCKDIMIPITPSGAMSVYRGSSSFSTKSAADYTNTNVLPNGTDWMNSANTTSDLNNDGLDDIIRGRTNGLYIYFTPKGGFTSSVPSAVSVTVTNSGTYPYTGVWAYAVGDYNGDGKNDLAAMLQPTSSTAVAPRVYIIWGRSNLSWPSVIDLKNAP